MRRWNEVPGFKVPEGLSFSGRNMKVELDRRSLFALASDTRLEMLKALQTNRRTVSQLAEVLGIDKAAVYRHLKKLEEGGLVTRTEDHGFVYYALTWKSRDILNPNDRTKIVILISSSLVCVLAMVAVVFLASSTSSVLWADTNGLDERTTETGTEGGPEPTIAPIAPFDSVIYAVVIILGISAVASTLYARSIWRLPCQRGGESPDDALPS